MIGLGMVPFLLAGSACGPPAAARSTSWGYLALVNPCPGSFLGWIFTEMGRQPWVVVPKPDALSMGSDLGSDTLTEIDVSPNVPAGQVLVTLILFHLLYGVLLGVMWFS